MQTPFGERLRAEFESRRKANPRYSMRAFAAFLATDHAVISQIFQGKRRPPVNRIQEWARKLGMEREETMAYVTASHVPEREVLERQEQLRHWAAEALSIVTDRIHFDILRLMRTASFQADVRWIAGQTGASVDAVNLAVSRLLRLRLLEMTESGEWRDRTNPPATTEREFRKAAMARVREMN